MPSNERSTKYKDVLLWHLHKLHKAKEYSQEEAHDLLVRMFVCSDPFD